VEGRKGRLLVESRAAKQWWHWKAPGFLHLRVHRSTHDRRTFLHGHNITTSGCPPFLGFGFEPGCGSPISLLLDTGARVSSSSTRLPLIPSPTQPHARRTHPCCRWPASPISPRRDPSFPVPILSSCIATPTPQRIIWPLHTLRARRAYRSHPSDQPPQSY